MPPYKYIGGLKKESEQNTDRKTRQIDYVCTMCGRGYATRTINFPKSASILYGKNEGHITVCRDCVDYLYGQYAATMGDARAAVKRVCSKFDIYYSDDIFNQAVDADTKNPATAYITKLTSKMNTRTYDDTIREDIKNTGKIAPSATKISIDEPVPPEVINFWGEGFTAPFYRSMQREYNRMCGDDDSIYQPAELIMIKDICRLQATIERDSAEGKPIDKNVNALHTLIGAMNLKPAQKKDSNEDANIETTPFGVWIRKIENTRPIAEPLPEWRDVDGIVKYITVWFFGHLCKMLKINNRYSQLYDEEVSKYTVNRPEYDEDDEDSMYEDIFERARASEEQREREEEGAAIHDDFDNLMAAEDEDSHG